MPQITTRQTDEDGMVTAELAFASLFAAGFVVLLAWVVSLLLVFAGCYSTASQVARQNARGDQAAVKLAIDAGPPGSTVVITRSTTMVTVQVRVAAQPWAKWLPAVPLTAQAHAFIESG
ncbi:MAG: hypothetical protein FWG47_02005 [Propionibacteriaceae bacterium]|nr:hypothetical protein [Propionibacteriaceae bacterium]